MYTLKHVPITQIKFGTKKVIFASVIEYFAQGAPKDKTLDLKLENFELTYKNPVCMQPGFRLEDKTLIACYFIRYEFSLRHLRRNNRIPKALPNGSLPYL